MCCFLTKDMIEAISGTASGTIDDTHWTQDYREGVPEGRICGEVRGYSLLWPKTITHEKP